MTEQEILKVLEGVVHPETGQNVVAAGMVENLEATPEKIQFNLHFPRGRDPFALSLKKSCEQAIAAAFPAYAGNVVIFIKESAPKPSPEAKKAKSLANKIRCVIAVSSAKGGVGKSTVTANLAVALARAGYRTGVLDADIYGPSQPTMFGLEDYRPEAEKEEGIDKIIPAERYGVKVMSIGFFIDPSDALIWRGPMATSALKQMIHQTGWGELDFLLVDLPPGTGDVHLSVIQELKFSAAIIVSTPQQVALADVVRGIKMFNNEHIRIPVLGIVENMAWFTPAELPGNRYYIFGREGARSLAEREGLPLLGEIPLVQSVREASDKGAPAALTDSAEGRFYAVLAKNVVEKVRDLGK